MNFLQKLFGIKPKEKKKGGVPKMENPPPLRIYRNGERVLVLHNEDNSSNSLLTGIIIGEVLADNNDSPSIDTPAPSSDFNGFGGGDFWWWWVIW